MCFFLFGFFFFKSIMYFVPYWSHSYNCKPWVDFFSMYIWRAHYQMESTYPLQMVKHVVEKWNGPSNKHFSFRKTYPFFFPSKFLMIPNGYLPNIILGICWVSQWKIKLKKSADPLCNLMPKPHYAGVGALLYTL